MDKPMFRTAPSHVYVAAHYDWRTGWRLSVSTPGLEGERVQTAFYDCLSTRELLDAACCELARVLALDTPPL